MVEARPLTCGEIRRGRVTGWLGVVASCALGAGLPILAEPAQSIPVPVFVQEVLARVPAALVSVLLAAPLLELMWRTDLRPRLRWDGYGIMVVHPYRTVWIPWHEITAVHESGDLERYIVIERSGTKTTWGVNHFWIAAKLSRRYAARAKGRESWLRAAQQFWANVDQVIAPGQFLRPPRHPAFFYVLLLLTATISEALF